MFTQVHGKKVGKHCSIVLFCTLMPDDSAWREWLFLPCFPYGQLSFVRTTKKRVILLRTKSKYSCNIECFLIKRSLCWQQDKWIQHFSSFLEHEATICCNWNVSFQSVTFNYPYEAVTEFSSTAHFMIISTFMTRQFQQLMSHVACQWCVLRTGNHHPSKTWEYFTNFIWVKWSAVCSTLQYENAAPLHYSSTTTSHLSTSRHHEAACCSTYARIGYIKPIRA
jgi:hypothetical protein